MTQVTSLDNIQDFRTRAQVVHSKGFNAKECLRKEIHQELFRDDTVSLQIWKMFHNKNSLLPNNKRILNMSWRIYSMNYLKKTRARKTKHKLMNTIDPANSRQQIQVKSESNAVLSGSAASSSKINSLSTGKSAFPSSEFLSGHVFVNTSPSDFKGPKHPNIAKSNADLLKQHKAEDLISANTKVPEASQEFDYIEHIRRLSGADDDPLIHFDTESDPLQPSSLGSFYGENTPSQPIPIANSSQQMNFTKPGSSFDSDSLLFSPIENGSFSSASGFSSYRKPGAGITSPMSTKSSFSAYPPSLSTFNSVADIPNLASTGSYKLQKTNRLQKNYDQLRQPVKPQKLGGGIKVEASNKDTLGVNINFDEDLKDIIDFSKFSDYDADIDLMQEDGNNRGSTSNVSMVSGTGDPEKRDSSLRYNLDSYINTLELSLNKHERKRKMHNNGVSGFEMENGSYPTPVTSASSLSSPSKSQSSKGPSPSSFVHQSTVMPSSEPSSITSTVLPGSSLFSGSSSFGKKEFRGHPVCENCLTSNTPLWRKTSDNRILCNACGLFFKLHGIIRPPVKNKFARGRLQAEMKKLRNYHQLESQIKARNPRDNTQISSGSQSKFRTTCEKPIISVAGSAGNANGKRMRDNDDWSWLNFE